MPVRTIKAVYFEYRGANGTWLTARKGSTVEIPEGEHLKRGDRLGAFVTEDPVVAPLTAPVATEEPVAVATPVAPTAPVPSVTSETVVVPADLSQVLEGNVGQVVAYAEDHPDEIAALLEAEQAKGEDARKGVVEGLTKLTEA